MSTLAITRHETHGCPPEPFDVTFSVAEPGHLVTVRGRGQVAQLRWRHKKGYRPGSKRLAIKAIEAFLAMLERQELSGGPDVDEANQAFAIAGRIPSHRIARDAHERQLPVADRA